MAQSDDGHLLKSLYVLPNSHLIVANELHDMAIFHDPYEHFIETPDDVRCIWRQAAEILKAIGDQSQGKMEKDASLLRLEEQQKMDDEQVRVIIRELRKMAEGVDRYGAFKRVSQWTRNIWYAAAEMLEHRLQQAIH